jgi:hypothetical protein
MTTDFLRIPGRCGGSETDCHGKWRGNAALTRDARAAVAAGAGRSVLQRERQERPGRGAARLSGRPYWRPISFGEAHCRTMQHSRHSVEPSSESPEDPIASGSGFALLSLAGGRTEGPPMITPRFAMPAGIASPRFPRSWSSAPAIQPSTTPMCPFTGCRTENVKKSKEFLRV